MNQDQLHEFRKEIDALIQKAQFVRDTNPVYGREIEFAHTKLQEAKMWAGKCLEVLGAPFPAEYADRAN